MSATLRSEETSVPIQDGEDVTIDPEYPWPSAYRGSKYSIVSSRKFGKRVLAWRYDDLQVYVELPRGLHRALKSVGKSGGEGTGSIRITAGGEVLTKVHADDYKHTSMAPVSQGWIPVYLGRLDGYLEFDDIDPRPTAPTDPPIAVWEGLPWHHGERWTVGVDGRIVWKWNGYRFESAFEHPELVDLYRRYRSQPGRLYINEYGHVWANLPPKGVPSDRREEVNDVFTRWQRDAQRNGKQGIQRLVTRRLMSTGGGDPARGDLPVHLGHISDFDGGVIPRPVVDDTSYFVSCGREQED